MRIGTSSSTDVRQAVAEAVEGMRAPHPASAALVFSTLDYEPEPLASAVNEALPGVAWVGSSTGAVLTREGVLTRGIGIALISAPELRVGVGAESLERGPRAAGRRAVELALAELPLTPPDRRRAVLLFFDSRTGNMSETIRGAVEIAGAGVAWGGGGAGMNLIGLPPFQISGGVARDQHVVAMALDFPSRVGVGLHHGWTPYGPPTQVTRSSGSLVQELEYEDAFHVYSLAAAQQGDVVNRGTFDTFAMTHPLGVPQAGAAHLIRDPLEVGPRGELRCVGEVPTGAIIRVMQGDPEELVRAAAVAAEQARRSASGPLSGALLFDCMSRSHLLGARIGEELASVTAALGSEVPWLGCLTLGEVGAFGAQVPQFHNKSAVVLGLPGVSPFHSSN